MGLAPDGTPLEFKVATFCCSSAQGFEVSRFLRCCSHYAAVDTLPYRPGSLWLAAQNHLGVKPPALLMGSPLLGFPSWIAAEVATANERHGCRAGID